MLIPLSPKNTPHHGWDYFYYYFLSFILYLFLYFFFQIYLKYLLIHLFFQLSFCVDVGLILPIRPWMSGLSLRHFLPHYVKTQYLHFRFQITFFYLGRFLKKLADDQWSSTTKGSIYHTKHMYIQPLTTILVDWSEIGCLVEVSAMVYICRYCIFTWYSRFPATHRFSNYALISPIIFDKSTLSCL